jgi:phage terminase large subunit-like protein
MNDTQTLREQLECMTPEERARILSELSEADAAALLFYWPMWARPDQLPPQGAWRNWLLLAGRGSGKTRAALEFARSEIENGRARSVALAAPTQLHARKILVEGESGILAICPATFRPVYEAASLRLQWPNGAVAHLVSSEVPDRIRGQNLDLIVADELCAWQGPGEFWLQLQLALRLRGPAGNAPRSAIATTPKNIPLLRELLADPGTITTHATTFDNPNLSPEAVAALRKRYENTSIGRQELLGELLLDQDSALWQRAWIDKARVSAAPDDLIRVIVAVDPSVSATGAGAETGIIIAGKDSTGDVFILSDFSLRGSPESWARRVVSAYESFQCDAVIAETNNGGALVASVLHSVGFTGALKMVSASRAKQTRAEPVSALYQQGRVHHCSVMPELEDSLCSWVPGEGPSPDRLDACVWACTELALQPRKEPPAWLTAARNFKPPRYMGISANGLMFRQ